MNKILSKEETEEALLEWAKMNQQEIIRIIKSCDTCHQEVTENYGSILCEQCEQVYDFCLPDCQPIECPFCKEEKAA